MKTIAALIVVVVWAAAPLHAHHGKDFLLVESYGLPHPKDLYVVTAEQLLLRNSETAFRDEPSLLLGITDRFAAEVHVHVEKEPGEQTNVEAIAPAAHFRLLDSNRLHVGLSAEYEIARHDAPDVLDMRVILGRELGRGAAVVNLGVEHSDERTAGVYAIGYRRDLESPLSWGVEGHGVLRHGQEHQLLVGLYQQISERVTFKAGIGAARGDGRTSALIRTGIVWRPK